MRARFGCLIASLAVLGGLLAVLPAGSAASGSIRPALGAPDPRLMVLTTSDLGSGAKITSQGYYKDEDFPSVISYQRGFVSGRVGASRLPVVGTLAEIGT